MREEKIDMEILRFGFDAEKLFRLIKINPTRVIKIDSGDRVILKNARLGWNDAQYAAFQLFAAISFALIIGAVCAFAIILLNLNPLLVFLVIPISLLGIIMARLQISAMANANKNAISLDIRDAMQHMLIKLESGANLLTTLAEIAIGGHGQISEICAEVVALVKEGENLDIALRETCLATDSKWLNQLSASLIRAESTGTDLSLVLNQILFDLESSMKHEIADYANECTKLSTIVIVLTGVLPGMLVFALIEGGFIFGFSAPVELFLIAYLIVFPFAKYLVQMKLAFYSGV